VLLASSAFAGPAVAEVRIAVAANFRAALEDLASNFQAQTGHEITISSGATGLLHAQITQGAPFDVFLAADLERPRDLIARGLAVPETLTTYARGRLVLLVAPDKGADIDTLNQVAGLGRVAIANPRTAPYGRAAVEVLTALNLDLTGRLAYMQNASGVVSAVRSGAADAGFAPGSALPALADQYHIAVPADLHDPIAQGGVLLSRASGNIAAMAFLDYLASEDALSTMRDFGYAVD
jgi:molybdate transport system substrate-binding protein